MAKAKEYPVRFTPRGLSDAWDSTDTFPGACLQLQNLIFDQSNPELVVARPGVGSALTTFPTFTQAFFVSVQIAIGNMVYGMLSCEIVAGKDYPFAYNITTGSFVTITGITSSNVPQFASNSGAWTPPTMAVIGTDIILTHPGFFGSLYIGVFNISNPAAPTWAAGNLGTTGLGTGGNVLPSIPTSVANFNNRAYYACGQNLYYSDVLLPTQMTNAGQALTVGDTTPITGQSGLPIQTTSSGIVASLMVFKSFQIWQITGDAAISGTLSQNYLSLNVGCISPRTIVQTPSGTIFAAIDGPYFISSFGQVLPLTKDANKLVQDIQHAYQNIVNPSRAAAGFSGSIYRICMDTIINGVSQTNDYWFDITLRRWSGPHTFAYDTISQVGNYFLLSSRYSGAALFGSPFLPSLNSVYNDNGTALSIVFQTSQLPKTQNINEKQVVQSTIELASQSSSQTYTITAQDEMFNVLGSVNITIYNTSPTWGGGGLWGSGLLYTSQNNVPATYNVPWQSPLVFKKISLTVTANSTSSLAIGTSFFNYQDCGYIGYYNQSTLLAPDNWDSGFTWDDGLHNWQ